MLTTVDVREIYTRCSAEFARRVHAVDGRWDVPTPLPGWDVRKLVNHIVSEERWTPPLFAGSTIEEIGSRLDGDLLGDDPLHAFDDAVDAEAAEAVRDWFIPMENTYREMGAIGPRVDVPAGAGPQAQLLSMMGR